jgi:hypothetical protein
VTLRLRIAVTLTFCTLVPCCSIASQQQKEKLSNSGPRASPDASPEDLLQRSYAGSRNLSLEESCSLLLSLSDAASKISSAKAKGLTLSWSKELFRSARQLPPSWNRAAFEKNALQSWSSVDPSGAFSLLAKVDLPGSGNPETIPEDLRSFAANTMFPRYWDAKGPSSLPAIRSEARQIGVTGEYPYVAMGVISQKLAARKEPQKSNANRNGIESIFREALEFYGNGPRVRDANNRFIDYLEMTWEYLSPPSQEEALRTAVEHLTRKEKPDSSVTHFSKVTTDKGTFSLQSRGIALLYRILPKIREVDPAWAKKLEDQYSDLKQAAEGGKAQHSSEMMVVNQNGASDAQVAEVADRGLQAQTLARVRQQAVSDPQAASSQLSSLTIPEFQSEALADLASGFASKDPDRAKDLFSAAQKSAEKLPPELARLRALTSLAQSAAALHDMTRADELMQKAFDLGEELEGEELDTHPGDIVYDTETFDELAKLTRFGARVMSAPTIARLDHLRDGTLQTFLLVPAAVGLQEKRSAGNQTSKDTSN